MKTIKLLRVMLIGLMTCAIQVSDLKSISNNPVTDVMNEISVKDSNFEKLAVVKEALQDRSLAFELALFNQIACDDVEFAEYMHKSNYSLALQAYADWVWQWGIHEGNITTVYNENFDICIVSTQELKERFNQSYNYLLTHLESPKALAALELLRSVVEEYLATQGEETSLGMFYCKTWPYYNVVLTSKFLELVDINLLSVESTLCGSDQDTDEEE